LLSLGVFKEPKKLILYRFHGQVYGNSLLNAPNGNILGMLPNNWATKICAAMLLIHLFSAFLVCSRRAVTDPWQPGGWPSTCLDGLCLFMRCCSIEVYLRRGQHFPMES
jgi:hypothetical protein